MGVLERDVEVGQEAARTGPPSAGTMWRTMGVGVDVVEAHPCAERAKFAGEVGDVGADCAILPWVHVVAAVDPVGGGVLGDDEEFFDACLDQLFGFAQDGVGGARLLGVRACLG